MRASRQVGDRDIELYIEFASCKSARPETRAMLWAGIFPRLVVLVNDEGVRHIQLKDYWAIAHKNPEVVAGR